MSPPRFAVILALVVLGVGCSDTAPPVTGTVPDTPTLEVAVVGPKTLAFTWADVATETVYRLRESADGAQPYTTIATLPENTVDHQIDVFLPARVSALYRLQACNDVGCAESSPVSPGGDGGIGYLKASNPDPGDQFGFKTAISGDGTTLAVGAWGEASNATGIDGDQSDNSLADAGAVYVFARSDTGEWLPQAYIKASNTDANDRFGWSVALSGDGNTLAVGAVFESSNATGIDGAEDDDSATNAGAAYVFVRDTSGAWTQQAYVKASNAAAGDQFGTGVSLSSDGDTLAVGANLQAGSGAAYVFTRAGTTWAEEAFIKASDPGAGDWFGQNLALSRDGTTLGVAANREDTIQTDSGAVYVFTRTGTIWSEQAKLKASNPGFSSLFGIYLAFSANGDTLAVGAFREDSSATGIDGDQSDTSAPGAGAVYVFTRSDDAWSQEAYIKASNTRAGALFGIGVALTADGTTLAVAAPGESSAATGIDGDQSDTSAPGAGAAYVFMRDADGLWSQKAYVKAPNTGAGDGFGWSRLSDDGSVLAISASGEAGDGSSQDDDSAPGAGAVYVY
jgi:hypothetical protein